MYLKGFYYCLLLTACLFIKCSDFQNMEPKDDFIIPNDTLAFYKIDSPFFYHLKISPDSVRKLGERIISYDQIISYDTTNFIYKITSTAADTLNRINFRYRDYCMQVAVVSAGKIIFGFYLWTPASSYMPDWFTAAGFTRYLEIYFDESYGNLPCPDPRKDPWIIQVLLNDNKLL
jgi:hypothetical protein